jgi:hypothetical protein
MLQLAGECKVEGTATTAVSGLSIVRMYLRENVTRREFISGATLWPYEQCFTLTSG